MPPPRLTKQQMHDALERARHDRLEREARGEPDPLDQWPDGPPTDDPLAMKQFETALREFCAARGINGD
jgi:hypothetical protein